MPYAVLLFDIIVTLFLGMFSKQKALIISYKINYVFLSQCLKESYVKALGVGIGFEVNRLDFKITDALVPDSTTISSTLLFLDGKRQSNWLFEETCIEDHSVAVAVHSNSMVWWILVETFKYLKGQHIEENFTKYYG